jgi:hypothetical protein
MASDIGKELDREDRAKAKQVYDQFKNETSDIGASKLVQYQRELAGEAMSRNLQGRPTVYMTGSTAKDSSNVVPFLYFYPTLSISLCAGCPQIFEPKVLIPYLDRGLVSVFVRSSFQLAPDEFQKVVASYPEYFLGGESFSVYRNLSATRVVPDSRHWAHHICSSCIGKRLELFNSQADKMDSVINKLLVKSSIGDVVRFPLFEANQIIDVVENAMANPTDENLREMLTAVSLADFLLASKAFGASAQLESEYFGSALSMANSLRISAPAGIGVSEYLDFAEKYRGTLTPGLVAGTPKGMLETVRRINTEVDRIQSSNRLLAGYFAFRFILSTPTLMAELIRRGIYGQEGKKEKPIISSRLSTLTKFKGAILSKYFGTSKDAIHVWQIRRALEKSYAS